VLTGYRFESRESVFGDVYMAATDVREMSRNMEASIPALVLRHLLIRVARRRSWGRCEVEGALVRVAARTEGEHRTMKFPNEVKRAIVDEEALHGLVRRRVNFLVELLPKRRCRKGF